MISTIEAAVVKVREAFAFDVNKKPLAWGDVATPFFGLFRSDNLDVVADRAVSARYTPHQTDDVVALVESAAHAFDGDVDVRCHFRNGHYVSIMPTKEHRRDIYGPKDAIFPRVIIRAGYDGKAFNATMGYYRDLCRNLVMMTQVSGTSVSIRHTSGLRDKMEDLLSTFQTLRQSWTTLGDVISTLENREVQMGDFLRSIYGEPDDGATRRSVNMHRKRTEAIFRRLQRERAASDRPAIGEDFTVSAWEAFNAVQGYTQHDSIRRGNPSEFERVLQASNDSYVKQAETLVLAMAS